MNLSNNFTLEQLTFSYEGERRGLDNTPNAEQIINLTELAMALEKIQLLLGYPLHINSAFRSPKVNAAVGGSPTSAHMEGYAADFTCELFGSPLSVCKTIATSDIPYDQIIREYDSWCHFSCDPRMRRKLTRKFYGQDYLDGLE